MYIGRGVLIGAVLLLATGCATVAREDPKVDVTGNWAGTWNTVAGQPQNGDARLSLKQAGAKVNGTLSSSGGVMPQGGPIEGVVSGDRLILNTPGGIRGDLKVEGNEMSGRLDALAGPIRVTLRRQ
jgi:hypothetical protein